MITEQLRAALVDGPATVGELALELTQFSVREVQIGVWVLTSTGQAQVAGKVPNLDPGQGRRRRLNLYELTARGIARAAADRRRA